MFCKQKKRKTILLFCLVCVFNVIDTTAQKVRVLHKKYKFDWGEKIPAYIPVEEQFMDEDAVILEEETNLNILNEGIYVWGHNINIKKHLRIKYLTEEGIKNYSEIVLPYFDPFFYNSFVLYYKQKKINTPIAPFDAVSYFAARIIKPDGSINDAILEQKYYKEKIDHGLAGWDNAESYTYHFVIKNLEVNDEVEIYYKCRRYWAMNYYFNSSIPKQNLVLEIKYPTNKKYVFIYHNNSEPNDSVLFAKKNYHEIKMKWERKNLAGCINEPGARPHNELPYISFYNQPDKYNIPHLRTFFGEIILTKGDYYLPARQLKYTWPLLYLDLVRFKLEEPSKTYSLTEKDIKILHDKKNVVFNKFYTQQTKKIADSNSVIKFNKIHNTIVDDVLYQEDTKLFDHLTANQRIKKVIEFLEKKKIGEKSGGIIYFELLRRLETDFYASPLFDSRIEDINLNQFLPSSTSAERFYYIILKKGDIYYYYPKKSRFGYYTNEIPFYLEATQHFLIPQSLSWNIMNLQDIACMNKICSAFKYYKTLNSTEFDNIRISNVLANVSLDSSKVTFDAKLKLRGQFSTMQRGYYQYSYVDSTVNPKYHQMISDIEPNVKLLHKDLVSQSKDFPFECNLRLKYLSGNIVNENQDGSYSINLQNWFNHIIYDNFSAKNRVMSFYPDFRFQDVYTYYIRFDHNIEVLNAKDFETNISNALGSYTIKLTTMQPNVIQLKSLFRVQTDFVEAEKVSDVVDIYSEIQDLNNHFLKVKIVD